MKALDTKLWRDVMRLRGQVLTIALVVAAGIACYVTMRATWLSMDTMRASYYEQYRFADVFCSLERAPESLGDRLAAIDGVALAHTRVVENVLLPMAGLPEPAIGRIISIPSGRDIPLNGLYMRSGRLPEPRRDDEVVVVESFANAHGLEPGDRIPAVMNGRRRDLVVVGIGLSPEYVFPASPGDFAPDDRRFAIMWMDRDVLAPAFQMEGAFNDVSLALQPNASLAEVLAQVDRIVEPYGSLGAYGRDKQLSNYMLTGELQQLQSFATMFPLVFLGVAAFLLNVVLSRLVNLQRQEIAVLKALGYSNRRIGIYYLELVSLVVLIGAVAGVALGAWLGAGMTNLYGEYFRFPTKVFALDFSVVAVAVLVSLLAGAAGAVAAVARVSRLPPAEAMRPPAPARYRVGWLEKMGLGDVVGPSAMMVARELRRRPLRLLLSALGIAAAIGILVVGRFSYDSFEYLKDTILHEEQPGDIALSFVEPIPASAVRELAHLPGVLGSEGTRVVPARLRAGPLYRDVAIHGVSGDPQLRRIVDRNARQVDVPEHGLAISRKLGDILAVGVGDSIAVQLREGERATRIVPVAMLVDDAFGLQGYMGITALHRLLGQDPAVSQVYLRTDPGFAEELDRRLEELPTVAGVVRKGAVIERMDEQTGEWMLALTLILSAFAAVIAIGVVYNNARVALSMRSRDLASLRVLGFTRKEISTVLLGELAVQLVVALPLGLWLGTVWAKGIMATVDPETYRMPIVISNQTYAFASLVVTAAGIVSALLVRRKLDRLDLIAVLKTRE